MKLGESSFFFIKKRWEFLAFQIGVLIFLRLLKGVEFQMLHGILNAEILLICFAFSQGGRNAV
jgi:hypothetical protein